MPDSAIRRRGGVVQSDTILTAADLFTLEIIASMRVRGQAVCFMASLSAMRAMNSPLVGRSSRLKTL